MTDISVQAPNGKIILFPEGTDRATMESAMKSYVEQTPKTVEGQPFTPSQPSPAAPSNEPNITASLRGLGLGTRAAVSGLGSIPGMIYDAGALPFNLLSMVPGLGGLYVPPFASKLQEGMTAVGLPEPKTDSEKLPSAVIEGASSALGGVGIGKTLANAATPIAKRIANLLTTQPVVQTVLGATGGAGGELAQQAAGENASPEGKVAAGIAGSVAGSLAPGAVLGAGRRILTPLPSRNTPEARRLVDVAAREGIDLPIGVATGNKMMKSIESGLGELPFSSGMVQKQNQNRAEQFNAALMKRTGETATDVSPATLDRAFDRIGGDFNELARNTTVNVDRQLLDDIQNVGQEYIRRLPTTTRPIVESFVDDFNVLLPQLGNNPQIVGEQLQTISSQIRKAARDNRSDPAVERALYAIVRSLDDAVERSMGPDIVGDWRNARREYRNLLAIDKAASGGTAESRTSGNLSPGALTASVRSLDPRGFARGRGEMNDLARLGDLLSAQAPNSGTAQRTGIRNMLTLTGPAATGGLIGTALGMPIVGMVAGAATPPTLQRFLQSKIGRNYLKNQAFAGPSPIGGTASGLALANALQQSKE